MSPITLFCYFLHFECGGVGGAVVAHAQGRPLHNAVLDTLNLPPLAQFVAVGSLFPAGAEQNAIYEVLGKHIVVYSQRCSWPSVCSSSELVTLPSHTPMMSFSKSLFMRI